MSAVVSIFIEIVRVLMVGVVIVFSIGFLLLLVTPAILMGEAIIEFFRPAPQSTEHSGRRVPGRISVTWKSGWGCVTSRPGRRFTQPAAPFKASANYSFHGIREGA